MALERWTDDRIDDLHALVHQNDKRLDADETLLAAHDLVILENQREHKLRSERRFQIWLMFVGIMLGQAATIAALIVTAGSH